MLHKHRFNGNDLGADKLVDLIRNALGTFRDGKERRRVRGGGEAATRGMGKRIRGAGKQQRVWVMGMSVSVIGTRASRWFGVALGGVRFGLS